MNRFWLIPILLLAALETRTSAATTGNAPDAVAAREDQTAMRVDASFDGKSFDNDRRLSHASSNSFLNWYGSDTVHNLRMVLAGALAFVLVLLALHLLLPSTTARQAKTPPCSASVCGCPHSQHASQRNESNGQNPATSAAVGNFLPLGISLDHLNAIGNHVTGQSGSSTEQYDELTAKIVALEEQLRQVTRDATSDEKKEEVTPQSKSSSQAVTHNEYSPATHSRPESDESCEQPNRPPPNQSKMHLRSNTDLNREKEPATDALFDSIVSETLAIMRSQ